MTTNESVAMTDIVTRVSKPKYFGSGAIFSTIAVILLLLAPSIIYPVFLMKVLCFALFASAFNLMLGFGGMLSFGHAMFFGGASYACAVIVKSYGFPPEAGILAGTLFAAVFGLLSGLLAIRRQGIYFAMVTLALAQMFYFYCAQAEFTGGDDGIQRVPRGKMFGVFDIGNDLVFYYIVLAIFVAAHLLIYRIIYSHYGQVLKSIRENEARAMSLGYDIDRYKLVAFVLSAALAGLAGSTKAIVFQLASLSDVSWQTSGEVVLMTLIGGVGTFVGPPVGALIIVTMQNYLGGFGEWVLIIQGAIFVVVVSLFRRGVIGEGMAFLKERLVKRTSEN